MFIIMGDNVLYDEVDCLLFFLVGLFLSINFIFLYLVVKLIVFNDYV